METYELSQNFRIGTLSVMPAHIRIEQLRPVIAAHRHSHTSYEIHYTAQGKGTVTVEGVQYPVKENTLYITGPDVEHVQFSSLSEPVIEYCLYLNCQPVHGCVSSNSPLDLFRDTKFWIGEDNHDISGILKKIIEEQRNAYHGCAEMTEALLRQILVLLMRSYQTEVSYESSGRNAGKPSVSSQYPIVEDAFFYGHQTLRLEDLAEILHLSNRQTQRFLQEHYGMTFSQKRTNARMAAAVQMLLNTELTVSEIAEEVGYSSGEHFSTAFHRHFHQTPSDYRKKSFEQKGKAAAFSGSDNKPVR